jgi:uncharacterized protein YciI
MQFLIIGKDGTDENAMQRRLAVREVHIQLGNKTRESGEYWYGSALLDDSGKMIGSMTVMDFPSEKELNDWLSKEPYVTGNVWQNIEVMKCNIRDPWQFNRPKEFFEERQAKSKQP